MEVGGSGTHYPRLHDGRNQRTGFTAFVDNLPRGMSNIWLKQIFKNDGDVVDVFVSQKIRKNSDLKFGFVRFRKQEQLLNAIKRNHGLLVKGCKMTVKEAAFPAKRDNYVGMDETVMKRNRVSKKSKPNQERRWSNAWRDDRSYRKVTERSKEDSAEGQTRIVHLEVVEENLEWLKRSAVGINLEPREAEVLEYRLKQEWPQIFHVRSMGKYKTLLTFCDEETKTFAITEKKAILLQHFDEVIPWSKYERAETKRVWVEIHGVPPHAWSRENFKRIVSKWGEYVCMDASTEKKSSFESAKVLIDTGYCAQIKESLRIRIDDVGMNIHIFECLTIQPNKSPSIGSPDYQVLVHKKPEVRVTSDENEKNQFSEEEDDEFVEDSIMQACALGYEDEFVEESLMQGEVQGVEFLRNEGDEQQGDMQTQTPRATNVQTEKLRGRYEESLLGMSTNHLEIGENIDDRLLNEKETLEYERNDDRASTPIFEQDRYSDEVLGQMQYGPQFNPVQRLDEEISRSESPSKPPGFEKGNQQGSENSMVQVPIDSIIEEVNDGLTKIGEENIVGGYNINVESLSTDDEREDDDEEFEVTKDIGEKSGPKLIDVEKARRIFKKLRDERKESKKTVKKVAREGEKKGVQAKKRKTNVSSKKIKKKNA